MEFQGIPNEILEQLHHLNPDCLDGRQSADMEFVQGGKPRAALAKRHGEIGIRSSAQSSYGHGLRANSLYRIAASCAANYWRADQKRSLFK